MKIIKNSLVILPALLLSLGLYTLVQAEGYAEAKTDSVSATRVESEKGDDDSNRIATSAEARERNLDRRDSDEESTSTASSSKSRSPKADEHRSAVALFVQNLLKIADRDGGIGEQVREVAKEQNDSGTSTEESIKKLETRSRLKTFLIGTDYKNLGAIRSELAKTEKRIERLNELASSTWSTRMKTDLDEQVKLLQEEKAKLDAFVKANESRFSLFGWFVRLVNR